MLNQKQITAFRAVMIAGSMNSAAEMLHVTQPAVSRLIRDLEDNIGVTLFVRRRGDALRPTADATTLFRDVERYFVGLEQVEHSVEMLRQRSAGRLNVAALPALYLSILPGFVGEFTASRPGIDVPLMATDSRTIVDWVETGRIDLGFVDWPFDEQDMGIRALPSVPALVALPEGHPLTAKKYIDPQDFTALPFISVARGTQLRLNVDRFFLDAGVERSFANEAHLSMAACTMVAAGHGMSIVDSITAARFWEEGVQFRQMQPKISLSFSAIYRRSAAQDVLLHTFLEGFIASYAKYLHSLPRHFMRRAQMVREL
ncbi:MAG TPA: LysR substrate-binding domain-containing protein [Paenirhodobacter sp.]